MCFWFEYAGFDHDYIYLFAKLRLGQRKRKMKTIVIDNGTEITKCGGNNQERPEHVFSTAIGRVRFKLPTLAGLKDIYIGDEAISKRGVLEMRHPMRGGLIHDWDDMEKIWHYCLYDKMNLTEDDKPNIVLTESTDNSINNKMKTMEIIFETFNASSVYIGNKNSLSLIGYGLANATALVVDFGNCVVCQPMYQGHPVHEKQTLDIDSNDLIDYFCKLLTETGYSFSSPIRKGVEEDMFKRLCYVAAQNEECKTVQYELPDGQKLLIGDERTRTLEPYFDPSLIGIEPMGIEKMLESALGSFYTSNIVLTGGNSSFIGLEERIFMCCKQKGFNVGVIARERTLNKGEDLSEMDTFVYGEELPMKRNYLTWRGGAILSSMLLMNDICIKRKEYQEGNFSSDKNESTDSKQFSALFSKYKSFFVRAYIRQCNVIIPDAILCIFERYFETMII